MSLKKERTRDGSGAAAFRQALCHRASLPAVLGKAMLSGKPECPRGRERLSTEQNTDERVGDRRHLKLRNLLQRWASVGAAGVGVGWGGFEC